MSDRYYTSRNAMQRACDIENKARGLGPYEGYQSKGPLYVERAATESPIFHLCENLPDGGQHVHFTGSSREIRAYLRGAGDYRYAMQLAAERNAR